MWANDILIGSVCVSCAVHFSCHSTLSHFCAASIGIQPHSAAEEEDEEEEEQNKDELD